MSALQLLDLPAELLLRVAGYLDPYELTVLGQACRCLHAVSRAPVLLLDLDCVALAHKHRVGLRTQQHLQWVVVPRFVHFPRHTNRNCTLLLCAAARQEPSRPSPPLAPPSAAGLERRRPAHGDVSGPRNPRPVLFPLPRVRRAAGLCGKPACSPPQPGGPASFAVGWNAQGTGINTLSRCRYVGFVGGG